MQYALAALNNGVPVLGWLHADLTARLEGKMARDVSNALQSYAQVKKQLLREFGRDDVENHKASVSRALMIIVERSEQLAKQGDIGTDGNVEAMDAVSAADGASAAADCTSSAVPTLTSSVLEDSQQVRSIPSSSIFSTSSRHSSISLSAKSKPLSNIIFTWGRLLDNPKQPEQLTHPKRCKRWSWSSKTVRQIACSWRISTSFYLSESGDVYCSEALDPTLGVNPFPEPGTISRGDSSDIDAAQLYKLSKEIEPNLIRTFTQLRALRGIKVGRIACGSHHACALSEDGRAYSWGSGTSGALGHGDFVDHKTPHEIAALGEHRVVMISVGGEHTLFLCEDNKKKKKKKKGFFSRRRSLSSSESGELDTLTPRVMFACGRNAEGQLGLGANGSSAPECSPSHVDVPKQFYVTSVHCGWDFSAIRGILDDEAFRLRGLSASSEPGLDSGWTDLSMLHASESAGGATGQGQVPSPLLYSLFMFGNNAMGQCGMGNNTQANIHTPTRVEFPGGVKSVVDVSCGQAHTLALVGAQVGEVYAWGSGEHGQLGTQSVLSHVPQAIDTIHLRDEKGADTIVTGICAGAFHSCCVTVGGRVFSWGMNTFGALGLGHLNDRGTPKQILFPGDDKHIRSESDSSLQSISDTDSSGSRRTSDGPINSESPTTTSSKRRYKGMSFSKRLEGRVFLYASFYSTTILCLPPVETARHADIGDSFSDSRSSCDRVVVGDQGEKYASSSPDAMLSSSNSISSGSNTISNQRGSPPREQQLHLGSINAGSPAAPLVVQPRRKQNNGTSTNKKGEKQRISRERAIRQVWLDKILPYWHKCYREVWVRKMLFDGIPADLRSRIWPLAIGNSIRVTPEMFRITLNRARNLQEMEHLKNQDSASAETGDMSHTLSSSSSLGNSAKRNSKSKVQKSLAIIVTDLARTFPGLQLFSGGGQWSTDLRAVLEAFACHRPDMGYVQGMSYIAGMLLLHIPDRYMVFQCLANLLVRGHLFAFYRGDIEKYCTLFSQILERQLPQISRKFSDSGIHPGMYFYPWIQTIFSQHLPLAIVSRIWDNFLVGGEIGGTAFLFRASIAIVILLQSDLMEAQFEDCMMILQCKSAGQNIWNENVTSERLFQSIERVSLSTSTMKRFRSLYGDVFEFHPSYVATLI